MRPGMTAKEKLSDMLLTEFNEGQDETVDETVENFAKRIANTYLNKNSFELFLKDCDFSSYPPKYTDLCELNLLGYMSRILYTVLYNWKDLFYIMIDRLNKTYAELYSKVYDVYYDPYTVEDIKEIIRIILKYLPADLSKKDYYIEYIKPYQLK